MAMELNDYEQDRARDAQTIIELTEANVSASGHGDEWAREVGFLHAAAEETAHGPEPIEFGDTIDLANALG